MNVPAAAALRGMEKSQLSAEVFEDANAPGQWVVWALDPDDGAMLTSVFSGPDAETRAVEYAEWKFAEVLRHEPDRRQYQQPPRKLVLVVR